MEYLLDYAREMGLEKIISQAMENENVHGVIVEPHPLWLQAWKFRITNTEPDRLFIESLRFRYDPKFDSYYSYPSSGRNHFPLFEAIGPKMDFSWLPEYWRDFVGPSNIIVTIQITPGSDPINISRIQERLQVVQQHIPVAELSGNAHSRYQPLMGGISIGHAALINGTLGGILRENIAPFRNYALSCGHVIFMSGMPVDQPAQSDSQNYRMIGSNVFLSLPKVNPSRSCPVMGNSTLNEMDVSLIELLYNQQANPEILNIGKVDGYSAINDLHSGVSVELNGRSSGHKNLILGGIVAVKKFKFRGQYYCFEKLIQLYSPSLFRLAVRRPVLRGDSGAWVCVQGRQGNEWCAMVVGQDRLNGYAILSEKIMTFLRNNGHDLSCC